MIFDMPSCGGCRTCELVCSVRHTEKFNPSKSRIKILDKENEPGYKVMLLEEGEGGTMACDGCKTFKEPLCVAYCTEKIDLAEIVDKFLKNIGNHT